LTLRQREHAGRALRLGQDFINKLKEMAKFPYEPLEPFRICIALGEHAFRPHPLLQEAQDLPT
jgi:hypothetical protein